MKRRKLGFIGKLMMTGNAIAALLLLMAYVLPYLPPTSFRIISTLSLATPILIIANVLFMFYWIIRLRKQFLLSLIVLLLGFNHLSALYKFENKNLDTSREGLKMLSYNVRMFNRNNWIKDKTIPRQIESFIADQDPDIICFQEYSPDQVVLDKYPYSYVNLIRKELFGQAIYSKYPIVNSGSLDFKDTGNNVIYADVAVENDTIRVFNMHLQSHRIDEDLRELDKEMGKQLTKKVSITFRKQQEQVGQLLDKMQTSPYPNIVAGDMNNTAFSYTYRRLSENHTDAFKVGGKGLGRTFLMDFIPLRIDYFFLNPNFEVLDFQTHRTKLSDHEPISVKVDIEKGE